MTDDERVVRESWSAEVCAIDLIPFEIYRQSICIGFDKCDGDLVGEDHEKDCPAFISEENYWSSARAFTEERKEQIRQKRREVERVAWMLATVRGQLKAKIEDGLPMTIPDRVLETCVWTRILSRLERDLHELTKGMKHPTL